MFYKERYTRFFSKFKLAFDGKQGLEIGGPSQLFTTDIFPIYKWADKIDGCNFSNKTLWEGNIISDQYIYMPNKWGIQYILEGSELNGIADNKYDFLLSCHNLEHIANPLKAIKEWIRVLKPGGFILLVLPDKRFTFDRKRQYTTFSHLLSDLKTNITDNDLTHLAEILKYHDLKLDRDAGNDYNGFKQRGEDNFEYRALHHHVFSQKLLNQSLTYFNFKIIFEYTLPQNHQIILAQK